MRAVAFGRLLFVLTLLCCVVPPIYFNDLRYVIVIEAYEIGVCMCQCMSVYVLV